MSQTNATTLKYDTRCYFNVRSKADISQLNLPQTVMGVFGHEAQVRGIVPKSFLPSLHADDVISNYK